ncbi:lipoyl(octanoyl) transferase LipB [Desertivirga brevis]|uniref:lipoyl(octanoyl) transferase LipB n=1 Tax=Desertivirga brevis TaxID=2810310 RepID=UPI001A967108|nr:lipoyl(octanoyl) transferase LipB [Pedobacter sp. SYSU D00873]
MVTKPRVFCRQLGLIPYLYALRLQQELREEISTQRTMKEESTHTLFICEHPSVITFGSSATEHDLLVDHKILQARGFELFDIRRGGRITMHNPGQLVVYPILNLNDFKTDIRWFIASLAKVVILTLEQIGIEGFYDAYFPGVWIKDVGSGEARKVCAIGVHLSRWISNHGLALNVNNDLKPYEYFIPCGINQEERGVTSIGKQLGRPVSVGEVTRLLISNFETVFDCTLLFA